MMMVTEDASMTAECQKYRQNKLEVTSGEKGGGRGNIRVGD